MHGFGDMHGFKEIGGAAWGDSFAYQSGTTGGAAVRNALLRSATRFCARVDAWSSLRIRGYRHRDRLRPCARFRCPQARSVLSSRSGSVRQGAGGEAMGHAHAGSAHARHASAITWSTPGGSRSAGRQSCQLAQSRTVYDERALSEAGDPAWKSTVVDSELKYHVRLWPSGKRDWDTFLNVIQVGTPGEIEPVRVAGDVEGVRVSRPGESDVLAVFNAQPSARLEEAAYHPSHDDALRRARLRTSGYTLRWTALAGTYGAISCGFRPREAMEC